MAFLFYFMVLFVLVKILAYDKHLTPYFIAAILIRVVLLTYHVLLAALPDSGNAFSFQEYALQISALSYSDIFSLMLLFDGKLYSILLGLLYKIFDTPLFAGELMNLVLSFGTIIYSYHIALALSRSKSIARNSAKVLMFIPFLSIYSVILLREAMFVFFLTGAVSIFASVVSKGANLRTITIGVFFLLSAVALHPGAAGALVGFLFFFLIRRKGRQNGHLKMAKVYFIIIGFITIWVILATEVGDHKLSKYINEPTDVGFRVSERAKQRDDIYLSAKYSENIGRILYVVRPFEFTVRPLFFEISGFFSVVQIIESLFVIIAISVLIFRWKRFRKNEVFVLMLFLLFGLLVAFSLGSEEVAQGFRHRAKLYSIIVPLYLSIK